MVRGEVAVGSILVLSEDSGAFSHQIVTAIAQSMLRLIVPAYQRRRIRFEPPSDPAATCAVHANLWESTGPRDQEKRRRLIAYIATKLLEGGTSFVIWHMDADIPWPAGGPRDKVYAVGCSYADTVNRWLHCAPLCEMLTRTHA